MARQNSVAFFMIFTIKFFLAGYCAAEDWPQSDAHKDVIFNMISCQQPYSACRDVEIGSFIEHCLITTKASLFWN